MRIDGRAEMLRTLPLIILLACAFEHRSSEAISLSVNNGS